MIEIIEEEKANLTGVLSVKILSGFLQCYYSGDISLRSQAEELLSELAEQLTDAVDYSLEKGVAGVGWLIEFLVQKGLLALNSDEVLEEVDDNCYKMVLNCSLAQKSYDIDYVLGLAAYHHIRAMSKNEGQNFYRHFIHTQCLVLLSDLLKKYLEKIQEVLFNGEIAISVLKGFSTCLLKISNLMRLLEKILEEYFYGAIAAFARYLQEVSIVDVGAERIVFTEVALLLIMAMKQCGDIYWENCFSKIYINFQHGLKDESEIENNSCLKLDLIERLCRNPILDHGFLEKLSFEEISFLISFLPHANTLKLKECTL